jgi:hypothetical protein
LRVAIPVNGGDLRTHGLIGAGAAEQGERRDREDEGGELDVLHGAPGPETAIRAPATLTPSH